MIQQEDYEIFDLVSALENAEGKGTTFYSFLNVPPTATTNEIAKAYKQKSKVLQCVSVFLSLFPMCAEITDDGLRFATATR